MLWNGKNGLHHLSMAHNVLDGKGHERLYQDLFQVARDRSRSFEPQKIEA